jgi:hypothetical protein
MARSWSAVDECACRAAKKKPGDAGLLRGTYFDADPFELLIPHIGTTALLQDTRCVLADT